MGFLVLIVLRRVLGFYTRDMLAILLVEQTTKSSGALTGHRDGGRIDDQIVVVGELRNWLVQFRSQGIGSVAWHISLICLTWYG